MAIDTESLKTTTIAPPRSTKTAARGTVTRTPARTPSSDHARRKDLVEGVFALGGLACLMGGQFADSAAITAHAPGIAHEAASLAETNDSLAKGIDYLSTVGPYAALMTAAMPLVLQVAANHKLVKAEAFAGAGVVSPDILSAQMKADMLRKQTEAVKAQQEAEAGLQNAIREAQEAQFSPNGQVPA